MVWYGYGGTGPREWLQSDTGILGRNSWLGGWIGAGIEFPVKLELPLDPRQCPRLGWTGLVGGVPAHGRGWNKILKVPSHPHHSGIIEHNSKTTMWRGPRVALEEEALAQLFPSLGSGGEAQKHSSSCRSLCSVISGVGELDVEKDSPKKEDQDSQAEERPYPDCPFLLLDVRDREAYEQCHIVGAYSYPIATLSRTMNPYTNNILEYKNAHGKIIIVYDNDERLASQAATTMCERGFENLFMLSGGLKVLAQKIPEGLITGTLPVSCQVAAPTGTARRRTTPRVPPTPAENKWRFSADDLQKLRHYLAEEQIPSDAASRLTRGLSGHDSKLSSVRSNPSLHSTARSLGSLSSRSHSRTSIQNRPWK
uniref:Centrosomal protein 41 n=1 Tax=Serinus canaria TaxID=9135 RepID=A0A8C9NGW7_SERCA